MRKWTYLVAGLLICGTAATVTSCIDNEEPAGITDLRGAKAELLRAKAQVEVAEAAIKTAQANLIQVKADLKAEKLAQEKLRTALLEAQTEDAKKAIEEEAALRAERAKASLIAAQQASAQADAMYQQALLEIEMQLATMKDDAYANALQDLLLNKSYSYTIAAYKYVEQSKTISLDNGERVEITYYEVLPDPENNKEVSVRGLIALSQELSVAKNELVNLQKQKMDIEFSMKPEDLTKKYTALKAYWEGVKAGEQEALDAYKKIEDTEITAWEEAYKQLETEIDEATAAKDAIAKKLEEDLVPLTTQGTELDNKYAEISELKIEVPTGIESRVWQLLWAVLEQYNGTPLGNKLSEMLYAQTSWVDGKCIVANGAYTIKLSAGDKNNVLGCFIDTNYDDEPDMTVLDYLQSLIVTAENQAQAERQLMILETNLTDATKPYQDSLTAWTNAKDAFLAAADKYKYRYKNSLASRKYDAYSKIIAAVDVYLQKATPTDTDKKDIKNQIADFLTQRMEIDGFTYWYKEDPDDATKNVTMQAALKDATESDDALTAFITLYTQNENAALGGEWLQWGGLFGRLYQVAENLWGEPITWNGAWVTSSAKTDMLTPITYELWKETMENSQIVSANEVNGRTWTAGYSYIYESMYNRGITNAISDLTNAFAIPENMGYRFNKWNVKILLGDGLANDYFVATYLRDNQKELISNNSSYQTFVANWQALYDANKVIVDKYYADKYALNLQKAELENAAKVETAKYEVILAEKDLLKGIMNRYFKVTIDENDYDNAEAARQAFDAIKNKIIDIEGGVKEPAEGAPVYTKGSLAEADEEIAICDNYLKALTADPSTYITVKDAAVLALETLIESKQAEIDAITVLWDLANKKKAELLKALTGAAQ